MRRTKPYSRSKTGAHRARNECRPKPKSHRQRPTRGNHSGTHTRTAAAVTTRDDTWSDAGDADGEAGSDDEDARSMMPCEDGDEAATGSGRETAAPAIVVMKPGARLLLLFLRRRLRRRSLRCWQFSRLIGDDAFRQLDLTENAKVRAKSCGSRGASLCLLGPATYDSSLADFFAPSQPQSASVLAWSRVKKRKTGPYDAASATSTTSTPTVTPN